MRRAPVKDALERWQRHLIAIAACFNVRNCLLNATRIRWKRIYFVAAMFFGTLLELNDSRLSDDLVRSSLVLISGFN